MSDTRANRPVYAMRLPYKNFNGLRIIGRDTATIAVVEQWAADQGHIDFIVTACNAHDALLEYFNASTGWINTVGHEDATVEDENKAEARYDAAVKAAREAVARIAT